MKDKLFSLFKSVYKKLPVNYKTKNKLKGVFYKVFGFLFKNTTSYRAWRLLSIKVPRDNEVKADINEVRGYKVNGKIAVQLHLYYLDLLEEFADYFNNIPYKFDLMVSVKDKKDIEYVKSEFEKVKNVENVYVEMACNRGRDVAPLVSMFGSRIKEYDYIIHVHSKKSLFTGGEQTEWRRYLLEGLMGSEEIVKSNFYMLDNGKNVGMVYPETFHVILYPGHTWQKNRYSRDELLERIGVKTKHDKIYLDYPVGTMFLAKVDAIRQFFEADIKVEEFPEEAGQTDGTIAHAFERCLGVVCRYNGYNILILDEKEKTYAYNCGAKNLKQYMIKSYRHMQKEILAHDIISFDIFDTLFSRKISDHHAIQKLVELKVDKIYNEKSNFEENRIKAEDIYRDNNPDTDADIDDIYSEFVKVTGWDEEKVNKVKELEIATEYELVEPKEELVQMLKELKHKYGKKIFLISDMQLRRTDIEKMLEKCGVSRDDYDEFLLSSEMNKRKDRGDMWEYFSKRYHGQKCIHIGDNELSDVQRPGDYKIDDYHVMSNKALFQISDIGRTVGSVDDKRAADSVELGLVLNSLFSEPFRYNNDMLKVKLTDGYEYGYNFFGPLVLNTVLNLADSALSDDTKTIAFAGEDDIFKRAFELIVSQEKSYVTLLDRCINVSHTEWTSYAAGNEKCIVADRNSIELYHKMMKQVFMKEEPDNPVYSKTFDVINNGIEKFVKDYTNIMGEALTCEIPQDEIVEKLMNALVIRNMKVQPQK